MKSSNKKVRTGMRLEEKIIEALDAEAKSLGWTRTMLVQQILSKFLGERDRPTGVRVVL